MSNPIEFLHQYQLNPDKSGIKLDNFSAAEAADGTTLWQHVNLKHAHTKAWLRDDSGLDKVVYQSLSVDETRPRTLVTPQGIMVVLRGVNYNPGEDPEDMVSIRLWIEENRVLSARIRSLLSIQDIVTSIEASQGPRTPGEFLTRLIDLLANRIGDFVNRIEDELSDAEDALETLSPSEMRAALGSLRRQIASVRRFLAPQRDALDRLYHEETAILQDRDKQRLREESDRISRYLEDLDLARERAVVLQEAFLSQLAQQQNNRMYVLSIVAAIFLPLTFVTGLFGMNVGGLPLLENNNGFVIASLMMVAATAAVTLFFKLKDWF